MASLVALPVVACKGEELGPAPQFLGHLPIAPVKTLATAVESINVHDRAEVVGLFQTAYVASEGVPIEWNGNVSQCLAGTNATSFSEATILRVNYFRTMAGLPGNVTLDMTWSSKCQEAALMMAAEGRLSHNPDPGWSCYTAEGDEAAGKANLYHGRAGPSAIDGYMDDWGTGNHPVGHRRWILYPPQRTMGTGSVPTSGGTLGANVLWVIGGFGSRPAQPSWVAWPPSGYLPYQLLPRVSRRWSFSYPGADFGSASVLMSCAGTNIPVTLEPLANDAGYGDNTLVWLPQGVSSSAPAADVPYSVIVSNVIVEGKPQSFSYAVTVIDPSDPGPQHPPLITREPADQVAEVGGAVSFSVEASGTPPLAYQWLHNGSSIPGASDSFFSLRSAQPANVGGYSVIVSNTLGAVTSRVALLSFSIPPPHLEMLSPNVLSWNGISNLTYGVESSADLNLSDWNRIGAVTSETGVFYFTNLNSGDAARFYRVVYP